jgi:hypothetical protein
MGGWYLKSIVDLEWNWEFQRVGKFPISLDFDMMKKSLIPAVNCPGFESRSMG